MSGEGLLPGRASRASELDDVLAYLARKRANAETMARKSPEFADQARWTMRQIDVFAGDLKAGLHVGEAAKAADLAASDLNSVPVGAAN